MTHTSLFRRKNGGIARRMVTKMSRSVRTLSKRDVPRLVRHFAQLSEDDLYLRFGLIRNPALLAEYLAGIDFERDVVRGIFGTGVEVIAVAHLGANGQTAELGLSVLSAYRRQKLASPLFAQSIRRSRVRGFRQLWIHCLSENQAILGLARKAGMRIVARGGEADAYLDLPSVTVRTRSIGLYDRQAAGLFGWLRSFGVNPAETDA